MRVVGGRGFSYAETAESFIELSEGERFWVFFCAAAPQLGKLLVGEAVPAPVLGFDAHQDLSRILLPFRRPRQHSIQNFFDLFSRHDGPIAQLDS
jgi:hypothetical protein